MENATLKDLKLMAQYQVHGETDSSALEDFYIPVLSVAHRYDRLSGFFSSHALSLAAKGVAALIAHSGTMRLICSPHLSPTDVDALRDPTSAIDGVFADGYFEKHFRPSEHDIKTDHVAALAWMLREGLLEVRLAVVTDEDGNIKSDALFHPKVGIVEDGAGNLISFSGSNNETASGWTENQEEFKVFKQWDEGQRDFFDADCSSFEAYWNGNAKCVRCFDLPSAFRERLIRKSEAFSKEEYVRIHYQQWEIRNAAWKKLNLFPYQKDAVAKWEGNGKRLMFEMATGSGKTRCAIGCINKLIESAEQNPVCVVVAVPTNDLCAQWEREINGAVGAETKIVVANSKPGHDKWRAEIGRAYSSFALKTFRQSVLLVLTTHATASSDDFIALMSEMSTVATMMFVGDEVHGMGATEHKKGLLAEYACRLGLSATPERMFDERGTAYLREYFGNNKYEFTLKDALAHDRVCPYNYYPIIVSLDEDERDRYDQLSERIRKLSGPAQTNSEAEEKLKSLLIERALVIAAARGKIPALKRLIAEHREEWGSHVLAFACPKNFNDCLYALLDGGIRTSPFTYNEKNRDAILRSFAAGDFKALLAMKCLDEGIDVPNAHVAILISSSTNPREYIQRIGRVIRKAQGKRIAYIYDFLVAPTGPHDDLIARDFDRAKYIAEAAQNAFEAIEKLFPTLT